MDQTVQTPQQDDELAQQLVSGRTLPYDWYFEQDIYRLETQRIFAKTWLYAGHTGKIANPGDFFTITLCDVPIIVTRDLDGGVNAFKNVCCHRGAEVTVEKQGNCRALQCHYHAWTYGLDGKLKSAPRARQNPGFRKEDYALQRLRVETYGPFIFVSLNEDVAPLTEFLGELTDIVGNTGVRLDRLRHRETREYELHANWKVVVENFLECYHCPNAHPSFAGVVDLSTYKNVDYQNVITQYAPALGADENDQQVKEGRYNYLWPNFCLNVYPGAGNVSTNLILPMGPGRTLAVYEFFYEEGVSEQEAQDTSDLIHQIMVEDIVLCESVQRGMAAGAFASGQLMLSHEHSIQHFQKLVHDAMSA
jgi:choline monooxygenase